MDGSSRTIGEGRVQARAVGVRVTADCRESFVRELRFDPGIGQFSDFNPSLERERLVDVIRRPDGQVTLAHTEDGLIVGYLACAHPDPRDRWGKIAGVYELLAIDVSRTWRGQRVAQRIMREAFVDPVWEQRIVIATAYTWHWDTEAMGMTKAGYAKMLIDLVRPSGFLRFDTDEPNIRWDEHNLFLARIGAEVSDDLYYSFQSRLFEYRL